MSTPFGSYFVKIYFYVLHSTEKPDTNTTECLLATLICNVFTTMSKSLEKRRKADRERLKRWRKKKLADGNKQIQLMLAPEAQKVLLQEKEITGEPFVHIINRAIIDIEQSRSNTSKINKQSPEQQKIVRRIRQLWSEGYTYSTIADIFNNEGLTTPKNYGKWQASAVLDLDRKK